MRRVKTISVFVLAMCFAVYCPFVLAASEFEMPEVELFPSSPSVPDQGTEGTPQNNAGSTGGTSGSASSATSSAGTEHELPVDTSNGASGTKPASSFTDVAADAYYAAPVAWAVEKGITNGVDATHFAPTSPCNRGQMVTFLWRAAGSPEPKGDASKFTDVKAGEYYAKAVAWAVENNITLGTSATTFEPSSPVSRAQAVTFLWRAQGKPSAAAGDTYADVEAGSYYEQAVQWAAAKNVTQGTGNGFEPSTTVNRAMSVTFLYRTYVGA